MPHARHPHAHLHAQARTRERRHRLAHEAARLMAESGIHDFHLAKQKAARRLGIADDAALPRNREIQQALRDYQRLFRGQSQPQALQHLREAALDALQFFAPFRPLLAGPVADGTADAQSPVCLHLHPDQPLDLQDWLQRHAIPARRAVRRLRLDRNRHGDVDAWLFDADDAAFELLVLPSRLQRQAPLSPVDEKPMQRLSAGQLQRLLDDDQADAG